MSDNQEQAAGSTPESGQPQPGEFKAPEGYRVLSEDEFGKYQRYEQQAKGFSTYHQTLNKHGLGSEKDFASWAPFFEFAKSSNLTADDFLRELGVSGTQVGSATQRQPASSFDTEKLKAEILSEWDKRSARSAHDSASKTEAQLLADAARKLAGKDGDPELIEAWLAKQAATVRSKYGDDHPLKGDSSPLDGAGIEKLVASWNERAAKQKGGAMAKVAQAAGRPLPPTVAGDRTHGGAVTKDDAPKSISDALGDVFDKIAVRKPSGQRATV